MVMFLKVRSLANGRKYLSYVHGYRDEYGKSKQKTIEKIGYLDVLEKEYDNPIEHFRNLAKKIEEEKMKSLVIDDIYSKKITKNDNAKNLGYFAIKKIYNELGLNDLLKDVTKNTKIEYDLNQILSFLVFMRIIKPDSKRDAFLNKNLLFEKCDFSLDDIYRSLSVLCPIQEEIQKCIWNNTKNLYNRDTSISYYDCTNYYFEIEYNDEDTYKLDEKGDPIKDKDGNYIIESKGLRKRGPEKNKRPDPIVQMGLLMDASEIPLAYNLFPGNESEKKSLIPILNRTKGDYDLGRTIVVADRGLNTSENILYISGTSLESAKKLNGYVYGQSVRGADEEFKKWVLEQNYITDIVMEDDKEIKFIHKSRIYPKKMRVVRTDKEKTKSGNDKIEYINVDQKQMVYYSQKYANKQKRDRAKMLEKAKDLIAHPDKYNRSTSYGVAGYINNLTFVKSTGEIADASNLTINTSRIEEEEKYDGYYSIVTSEEHLSDLEIRKIYRGLAKIEETFKVTKSGLENRPVFVKLKDHIESHFLICFISLVIVRLLEKKLENKYSFNKILQTIRSYTSSALEHDIYHQTFTNDVIQDIGNIYNIDLQRKYMALSEIRKILK